MPVKIRLTRMGKKKQPSYRVVVVDSRKPRDGAYIEQIGRYDPHPEPSLVEIDNERAVEWLQDGAQPTERARKLLEVSGAWGRFRVARGDIHTIDETFPATAPGDTTPEEGDAGPANQRHVETEVPETENVAAAEQVAEAGDQTEAERDEGEQQ